MSKEIHATGNGSTGPMSPNAVPTRGVSQAEATGSSDTNGMQVGSQVGPIVIKTVEDHRASDAQLPAQPAPRAAEPADPKVL